jgi:hypothetical protein
MDFLLHRVHSARQNADAVFMYAMDSYAVRNVAIIGGLREKTNAT